MNNKGMSKALSFFLGILLCESVRGDSLSAGTLTNTFALNTTGCFAPTGENGSWGFCGPLSCKDAYRTEVDPPTVDGVTGTLQNGNTYPFLDLSSSQVDTDYSLNKGCLSTSTCTQVTTGICTSENLANIIAGDGVKAAYCNDLFLVIAATGLPSVFEPNLDDVPYPPANSDNSAVTGMSTIFSNANLAYTVIPLNPVDLNVSDVTNNLDLFDDTYLTINSTNVGIPADNAIGVGVNGQPIFPVYNNQGGYTPLKCEVDSCNEHVGQGGGAPHFHGDMFGDEVETNCLYGPSNYTDGEDGHPPLVGFSYDGFYIYGRYLSSNAPGFQSPSLDICGGHKHDDAGTDEYGNDLTRYHYHTQVFTDTCVSGSSLNYYICDSDETYAASTTGPYQCWRGDANVSLSTISKIVGISTDTRYKPCCQMSEYYLLTGVGLENSNYVSTSCTRPSDPNNGSYNTTTCPSTLYSGYVCELTCETGYMASGSLQCLGGSFASEPTCIDDGTSPSPSPSPSASSSSSSSPSPSPSASSSSSSSPSPSPSASSSSSSSPSPSPSPSPSTSDEESSTSDDSSSNTITYASIGGACAGVVVVLVLGGYCFMRRRMKKSGSSATNRYNPYA